MDNMPAAKAGSKVAETIEHPLVLSLRRLDPLLQFLTRATGQVSIPLPTIRRALPSGCDPESLLIDTQELIEKGVLHRHAVVDPASSRVHEASNSATFDWQNGHCRIGFPPPPSLEESENHQKARNGAGSLHGSTKTAAKRRLAALNRILKAEARGVNSAKHDVESNQQQQQVNAEQKGPEKKWADAEKDDEMNNVEEDIQEEERIARKALSRAFGLDSTDKKTKKCITSNRMEVVTKVLSKQASYAGSTPAQEPVYAELSDETCRQIPPSLFKVFGLNETSVQRRTLYRHQATIIDAAVAGVHCSICTGTGSGKSLSFLLPPLAAAYNSDDVSLFLFPTKALAQDQLSKLSQLLNNDHDLMKRIRPATLDGDTPHSLRSEVADSANIILTNPDTLHAAVLPTWRPTYESMLSRVKYIVVDEAHIYEGVFGAHVAMILSRLARVILVAQHQQCCTVELPTFIAASATLPWPEQHFRLLCPIAKDATVRIVTSQEDGSPRSAKHFFVWNPPILYADGTSTERVSFPRNMKSDEPPLQKKRKASTPVADAFETNENSMSSILPDSSEDSRSLVQQRVPGTVHHQELHRRHAADETARLLARAVTMGVRCIAFCKTRNLVEWVFERTLAALKSDPSTADLASRIESYRGGYSIVERRQIEQRLFRNELLGVVGTNALELGVDIGGIDLTLHCGYPSSYASLFQQAGRAGRGSSRLKVPSLSITVSFNSPSEQHLWRHPKSLLGKGISAPQTISISSSLVQGHLLCAANEFPLGGPDAVTAALGADACMAGVKQVLCDYDLFGGCELYMKALHALESTGSVVEESRIIPTSGGFRPCFLAHPSMKKAWSKVSIRSIEPINYAVVDISHRGQAGRMDGIHDEQAILDTLPYSRIFYHAHPGAIVTHRGRKYKIVSMTHPPAFVPDNFCYRRSMTLAAFAKPTREKYMTRPLSNLHITVVKQIETVEIPSQTGSDCETTDIGNNSSIATTTLAGCGAVSVRRTVHGYKKLSLITRAELSRTELNLPPMEYDTFGIWIDIEADILSKLLGEDYGRGVHAFSHALLAVAPLFAPGLVRSDLDCDHSYHAPTRVMLFDERAGGSGASQRLWELLFQPHNLIEAAVELLEHCSSCRSDHGYDGGCPACLHDANCLKFNMHLSRTTGAIVGRRVLQRIQRTDWYKKNANETAKIADLGSKKLKAPDSTPRRKARQRALEKARELRAAQDRQFVVARPTWPLDGDEIQGRQIHG